MAYPLERIDYRYLKTHNKQVCREWCDEEGNYFYWISDADTEVAQGVEVLSFKQFVDFCDEVMLLVREEVA